MLIMCNRTISQRQYYNISPCWSFSTAGILVHYRRCNLTLLESRSRAGAGVRLNSRYYQVAVLETCSTGWRSSSTGWRLARQQVLSSSYWRLARQQVLETCSTAGGKMQLHISFERRERVTPDRTSNLNLGSLYGKYKCGHVMCHRL